MIPIKTIEDLISKHSVLEKELSSGNTEPKLFAKKSKDYSRLRGIVSTARLFVNFENEKRDLENIMQDKTNDQEMVDLAQKDLNELMEKKEKYENELKLFFRDENILLIFLQIILDLCFLKIVLFLVHRVEI